MTFDVRVAIREAQGSELRNWMPGKPLPKRILKRLVVPPSAGMCPFGPNCIRCYAGYTYSGLTGEHSKQRTMGGMAFRRRVKK